MTSLTYTTTASLVTLTWTPPHSPDVIGIDPDITYCVDVVNSFSLKTLQMECGIAEAGFNYTLPLGSWCYITMFTVISVNVARRQGGRETIVYIGADSRKKSL